MKKEFILKVSTHIFSRTSSYVLDEIYVDGKKIGEYREGTLSYRQRLIWAETEESGQIYSDNESISEEIPTKYQTPDFEITSRSGGQYWINTQLDRIPLWVIKIIAHRGVWWEDLEEAGITNFYE